MAGVETITFVSNDGILSIDLSDIQRYILNK